MPVKLLWWYKNCKNVMFNLKQINLTHLKRPYVNKVIIPKLLSSSFETCLIDLKYYIRSQVCTEILYFFVIVFYKSGSTCKHLSIFVCYIFYL